MQRLDLTSTSIRCGDGDEAAVKALALGLAGSGSLLSLLLGHNQISSAGVTALAAALLPGRVGHRPLRLLDVRCDWTWRMLFQPIMTARA